MRKICVLLLLLFAVPNIYTQENNTQDASTSAEKENSWLSYFFANPVKQDTKIIPYKQTSSGTNTDKDLYKELFEGPGLLFFIIDSVQSRREPVGYNQHRNDQWKNAEEEMKIIERTRR